MHCIRLLFRSHRTNWTELVDPVTPSSQRRWSKSRPTSSVTSHRPTLHWLATDTANSRGRLVLNKCIPVELFTLLQLTIKCDNCTCSEFEFSWVELMQCGRGVCALAVGRLVAEREAVIRCMCVVARSCSRGLVTPVVSCDHYVNI